MIYLDNAATTFPKPAGVISAVDEALKNYGANPGRSGYRTAVLTNEKIYDARENLSRFFAASIPDNTAFTLNCTYALNIVLKTVLNSNDVVVTSDIEHNSVIRPLEKLKRDGISVKIFKTYPYDSEMTLRSFKLSLNEKVKAVVINHASNVFGFVNPIEQIGEICKEKGIVFIVDGAQSAGILPIDIKRCNINFLCVPGHKGLYGPMGTGAVISADNSFKNFLVQGGTGSASLSLEQPDFLPDAIEAGTVNTAGIIGLGAGVKFVKEKSLEKIYGHEKNLVLLLNEELKNIPEIKVYTDYEKLDVFSPVFSFNIKDIASEKVAKFLSDRGICVRAGIQCAPVVHKKMGTAAQGVVRISPSIFTKKSDIIYASSAIKNAAKFF